VFYIGVGFLMQDFKALGGHSGKQLGKVLRGLIPNSIPGLELLEVEYTSSLDGAIKRGSSQVLGKSAFRGSPANKGRGGAWKFIWENDRIVIVLFLIRFFISMIGIFVIRSLIIRGIITTVSTTTIFTVSTIAISTITSITVSTIIARGFNTRIHFHTGQNRILPTGASKSTWWSRLIQRWFHGGNHRSRR